MSNETHAEVLAEMRQTAVQAIGPVGKMMGGTIALWADRIERSLAAGKAPVASLWIGTGCGEGQTFTYGFTLLDSSLLATHRGGSVELYTAPPADPAKADSPPFMRGKYRAAMEAEAAACIVDRDPAKSSDGDGWEENAKYLLDRCKHTIRVREGGGPESLLESLIATFMNMEGLLEQKAAKASGSAPDGWREFLELWSSDGHLQTFEDRERFRKHAQALLATPPASAPEVTERRLRGLARRWEESAMADKNSARKAAKLKCAADLDALTAALQQEGKSHG